MCLDLEIRGEKETACLAELPPVPRGALGAVETAVGNVLSAKMRRGCMAAGRTAQEGPLMAQG